MTMRTVGEVPTYDFPVRDHIEIGEALGAIDMERGAKVSGARFYFLTGPGALLEFALAQLAISRAVTAGFTPVIAPALVKPEAMEGTGFLGEHDEEVYRIERDDLYLVGTSEVALAGMHAKEVLDLSAGPRRYAGWSSCFRREAGSYGKDTRGIIRVHWFDKVEMFSFCRPEETAGRAPAAAAVGGGVPPGARAALPRRRHRRRRPRHQRHAQVRHRGVVPDPGHLPRADVDLGLHHLPGPPAEHPLPGRRRQAAAGRHAQRHPLRDRPHHRLPARGAPARRRLGLRAQGAAAVAGRRRGADPGHEAGGRGAPRMTAAAAEGAQGLRRPPGRRLGGRARRPGPLAAEARRHRPRRHAARLGGRGQPAHAGRAGGRPGTPASRSSASPAAVPGCSTASGSPWTAAASPSSRRAGSSSTWSATRCCAPSGCRASRRPR